MLFRRTAKLVELDNAKKALAKAKPKNEEQVSVLEDFRTIPNLVPGLFCFSFEILLVAISIGCI